VVGSTAPVPHIDSVAGAGASFPPVTSLSSNAYVMVKGSNFAPTGTSHVLGSGDLDNGNLPTQLAGVCVTIGGASALITYVSPNQINLVTPDVPGNTTVNVQVTAGCDTATPLTSNLMPASTQASTPEFFYWVYNPNGQNPVVAVDNTTGAYVGAASLSQTFPNLTFTPASPGEILDIYGASFGPTNPSFDPGVAPTTAAQVTVTPVVTLGPITMNGADVLYAGVSPGTGRTVPAQHSSPGRTAGRRQPTGHDNRWDQLGGRRLPHGEEPVGGQAAPRSQARKVGARKRCTPARVALSTHRNDSMLRIPEAAWPVMAIRGMGSAHAVFRM